MFKSWYKWLSLEATHSLWKRSWQELADTCIRSVCRHFPGNPRTLCSLDHSLQMHSRTREEIISTAVLFIYLFTCFIRDHDVIEMAPVPHIMQDHSQAESTNFLSSHATPVIIKHSISQAERRLCERWMQKVSLQSPKDLFPLVKISSKTLFCVARGKVLCAESNRQITHCTRNPSYYSLLYQAAALEALVESGVPFQTNRALLWEMYVCPGFSQFASTYQ